MKVLEKDFSGRGYQTVVSLPLFCVPKVPGIEIENCLGAQKDVIQKLQVYHFLCITYIYYVK